MFDPRFMHNQIPVRPDGETIASSAFLSGVKDKNSEVKHHNHHPQQKQ